MRIPTTVRIVKSGVPTGVSNNKTTAENKSLYEQKQHETASFKKKQKNKSYLAKIDYLDYLKDHVSDQATTLLDTSAHALEPRVVIHGAADDQCPAEDQNVVGTLGAQPPAAAEQSSPRSKSTSSFRPE